MNASVSCIRILICTFFLISCAQAKSALSQFWVEQIDSALTLRDYYFSSISIQVDSTAIQNWDYDKKIQALELQDVSPSLDNPWYHITRGLIDGSLSDTNKAVFFNRALFLAQSDPGTTWLLFYEFNRNQLFQWAYKSLEQLQKLLLQSGAYTSTVISQQLIHLAISAEKNNKPHAKQIYSWAKKFDSNQTLSSRKSAWISFPSDLEILFNEYKTIISNLKSSWILQLQLAENIYNWFRITLICFIFATIFILIFKYIHYSLHNFTDLLPYTVPLYLRNPLALIVFLSLVSFGLFPLLWLGSLLIWKFVTGKEKIVLSISLFLLAFSPVDSFVRSAFLNANNPQGAIQTYSRAVNEGYTGNQYNTLLSTKDSSSQDYLAVLSAAIYELKLGDYASATVNIRKANSLCSNDPVILNAAGNLHFLKNDIEKAEIYYRKSLTVDKKNAEAMFNIAQCQLRKMKTITAAEYISDAAQIRPDFINIFIHDNEKYFSRNWPQIRQIIFSDLSAHDFWTKHFIHYCLSWKAASLLWNPVFFTIPPVITTILLTILLLSMIILFRNDDDYRKMKKIFECRFCGRIICRKCKSGTLCHSCYESTQFMSNENSLEKMRKLISNDAKKHIMVRNTIIDILFPGLAQLLENDFTIRKVMAAIFLTSLVYASYAAFFSSVWSHNINLFSPILLILVLLTTYNVYFIVKRLKTTIHGFRRISESS